MNDADHDQRMKEILQRAKAYRQRGVEDIKQAHDDIDYLFTRANQLDAELEACNKARLGEAHERD